jgi:hypothetical protein
MVSTTTTNSTVTNDIKPVEGESKQTKKIRDTNDTTLMLVVVITVRLNGSNYSIALLFL